MCSVGNNVTGVRADRNLQEQSRARSLSRYAAPNARAGPSPPAVLLNLLSNR